MQQVERSAAAIHAAGEGLVLQFAKCLHSSKLTSLFALTKPICKAQYRLLPKVPVSLFSDWPL